MTPLPSSNWFKKSLHEWGSFWREIARIAIRIMALLGFALAVVSLLSAILALPALVYKIAYPATNSYGLPLWVLLASFLWAIASGSFVVISTRSLDGSQSD